MSLFNLILKYLSLAVLKVMGWKVVGKSPNLPKIVMVAAPHTANFDLLLMILCAFYFRKKINWFGKKEMFQIPIVGRFFSALGGIPIERSYSTGVVDDTVNLIKKRKQIHLCIPPEGTRFKKDYWHSGFYFIALRAQLPIALGFIDYQTKTTGYGPWFYPTGNIVEDFKIIQDFYKNIKGKYPERQSTVQLKQGQNIIIQKKQN